MVAEPLLSPGGERLAAHRAKLARNLVGKVCRGVCRTVGGVRALDREPGGRAGENIAVARCEHSVRRHAVRGGVIHEEDVVRTGALRAVGRAGNESGLARARLTERHRGRAAAVQTERTDAAELFQLLAEFGSGQTRADRGLVAVDFVKDDRAVALDADSAACAARGRGINARGRDCAVVDEQLAADRVLDLAPRRICGGDGERDLSPTGNPPTRGRLRRPTW